MQKRVNLVDLENAENDSLVAKIGVDTAENEPSKVCRYIHTPRIPGQRFRYVTLKVRPEKRKTRGGSHETNCNEQGLMRSSV